MLFYNFGVRLYAFVVNIAALFNPKAKKWVVGRRKWKNSLPDTKNKKVIWFHCASLGEFEQGRPVLEDLRNQYPEKFILLTFFSPSGYEVRKNYQHADHICYLPIDTPTNAKKFINHFQPSQTFFVKYEIWINYLNEAKKSGSKLYLISALFRPNHRFFKWYGGKFRKALALFDLIFVQNQLSFDLLSEIKLNNIALAGDTRYDRVSENAQKVKPNLIFEKWLGSEKAFVIGSSWPDDENLIFSFLKKHPIEKVIIAPHEVNEKHIEDICKKAPLPHQLYSSIEKGEAILQETQLIIIDCIGILADTYQYGKYAYVGGGFGTGLHNILEPACFGLPVMFGPIHTKFPEAQLFIDEGIGFEVSDLNNIENQVKEIQGNLTELNQKTLNFINENKGAKAIILERIQFDKSISSS